MKEGAGNAGRAMHPQPRMQMSREAYECIHHRFTGTTRHFLRNGVTVTPWSPWCAGLFSHHRPWKLLSTNLTPASGCQDHTAWPSAFVLHVQQPSRVHCTCPTFATLAYAPLVGTGWTYL